MEQLFKDAKVGDKVIAYGAGRGIIAEIDDEDVYPIDVTFSDTSCNDYKIDGRLYEQDLAPICFPIDKAPQHLLDMFPEEKTFREYLNSRTAFGLFDQATNCMVQIMDTREEAEEAAKFFVSSIIVVECIINVSFDLEVSA